MAYAEYFTTQRRLLNILANCDSWEQEQLERAMDGLVASTLQMVRVKRERTSRATMTTVVQNVSISSISDSESSYSDSDSDSDIESGARPQLVSPRRGPFFRLAPAPRNLYTTPWLQAGSGRGPTTPPGTPLREPPRIARVMQNQTGGLTLPRPRVLLQQIRASSARTAAALDEVVVVQPTSLHLFMKHHVSKRAIGDAKFNANCKERCAICLDTHTIGDSMITKECNHSFGKQCWQNWMTNPTGNQSCPECRHTLPRAIWYTLRKSRKNNAPANAGARADA